MSAAARNTRILDAVFLAFGEDAAWEGFVETVRVRRREEDEPAPLSFGTGIILVRRIRVRQTQVAQPEVGQLVQILDEEGEPVAGAAYRVTGDPTLDRKQVWSCPVELAV